MAEQTEEERGRLVGFIIIFALSLLFILEILPYIKIILYMRKNNITIQDLRNCKKHRINDPGSGKAIGCPELANHQELFNMLSEVYHE